jgi:DNA-binding MarR family transcriptional regulator
MPAQRPAVRADLVGPAGAVAALHFVFGGLFVAGPALERCSEACCPPLLGEDPGTLAPGRLVPHVLTVATGQKGHPVPRLVPVEADDRSLGHQRTPLTTSTMSIVVREYRETMVLRNADYEDLLALRTGLRRFLRWSEQQAGAAGLTPAQHQLLLAVRGHPDRRGPTVGEAADYLLLRHHSAVGLVDRAVSAKLVKRVRDPEDHRVVRLQLTAAGSKRLEALSEASLEELGRLGRTLPSAWRGLMPRQPLHGIATRP